MPMPDLDPSSAGLGAVLGSLVMLIVGWLNYRKSVQHTNSAERIAQGKHDHILIKQIGQQLDLAWAQIRAEQAARIEDRVYYQKMLKRAEQECHRKMDELREEYAEVTADLREELDTVRQRTDPAEGAAK